MNEMTGKTLFAGALGIIVGAGGMWLLEAQTPAIRYVEGFAYANSTGDAVALSETRDGAGEGYTLLPQVGEGEGQLPTCMEPLKTTPVRLGLVHVEPQDEVDGRDVVVYVECTGPSEDIE